MSIRGFVLSLVSLAVWVVFATAAAAQSVQPLQGQSPEQMQSDVSACQASAVQSSGFDPAAPPSDERSGGGRARGAAKGAAAGAVASEVQGRQHDAYEDVSDDVKQEHRQEDARSAAAAGAAVAGSRQRQDRRGDRRSDRDAKAAYDQAYQSCLSGRGYSIKP